ncbi:MAG: response regulator [Chloroflexi bacterium]|nr:response regulator [Chloroflexota bacterium]
MTGLNPSSPPADDDATDTRRLILIVDDEPSVRAMVHASIQVRGVRYRAVEAANAAEALALAASEQPRLILLDVGLPDHDGFWVCRALKNTPSTAHIPVIMLTAMSLPSDRAQAITAGADGYIVKPFSPRALLEELDRRLP